MNNQCNLESVYDKCAYKHCRNGRFSTGAHLFRFPSSTDIRHKLWIRNSGKFLKFSFIYFYIVCTHTHTHIYTGCPKIRATL